MKTCIYIASFPRDYILLQWAVASIQKFLKDDIDGVNSPIQIVVTIPKGAPRPELPAPAYPVHIVEVEEPPGKGFLIQMILKCQPDLYAPGFDRYLHWDSDCILTRPTELHEFGVKRPIVYYGSYESLFPAAGHLRLWQQAVKHAIGFNPVYEFMRCFPMQYPASVYPSTRRRVELTTRKPFDQYVLGTRNAFPQTFCEFNTLGAWAWLEHKQEVDFRDWRTGPAWGWETVKQFWGPGGPDFTQPHQTETPRQCAQRIGLI
jgi:hypothetical protein